MVRRLLALLGCLVLLAGCDLTDSHRTQRTGDVAPDATDTIGVTVSRIKVGEGTVSFTVTVPSGAAGCSGEPQAKVVGYDAQTVNVDTVVDTSLDGSCPKTSRKTFTAPLDLQGRHLRVNGVLYKVAGSVVTACDATLGCDPPADRCDPAWTRTVVPHFDLPPDKITHVVACHAHWLILDVTATTRDGAVQYVRWFAELDPQRSWLVVASSRTGGCVDVRLAVPSFPVRYCRDLKAPGVQKTTS